LTEEKETNIKISPVSLSLESITRGSQTVLTGQKHRNGKMALVDSDPLKCHQKFDAL